MGADVGQDDLVGLLLQGHAVGIFAEVGCETVVVILQNRLGVQVVALVGGGYLLDPFVGGVDLFVVQGRAACGYGEDGLENHVGLGRGLLHCLHQLVIAGLELLLGQVGHAPVRPQGDDEDGGLGFLGGLGHGQLLSRTGENDFGGAK